MAGVTNKQRYEKSSIYEKKLLALHKAITIRQTIVLRRIGVGGGSKSTRPHSVTTKKVHPTNRRCG